MYNISSGEDSCSEEKLRKGMEEWGHPVLDRVTKKACYNEVKFEKSLD